MHPNNKTYLFEEAPLPTAVAKLAIPTIISSMVTVLYNLADTYFVGMLNDPIQNSAVTLAAPVMLAFYAINNLFGVGSSSLMSPLAGLQGLRHSCQEQRLWLLLFALLRTALLPALLALTRDLVYLLGADETTREATNGYMLWTVYLGAAPTILNVVLAYLVRAEGSAIHASVGTMSGCLLNIVLDPIFILPWGLNMGAAGAGLATFLSNCVACLYYFVLLHVRRGHTYVCVDFRHLSFERHLVGSVCKVGIPAAIQNLLNVTGMTILNNFTSAYRADAVAAMGICQKLAQVPMYASMGFSQGVMPLVSYNYSSGNIKRMKSSVKLSGALSVSLLLVLSVLFQLFPRFFVSLFMKTPEVVEYGSHFLRGMAIAQPLMCIDFLAVGVFQAVGLGSYALAFAILRKVVLEIPALIILNAIFPLYGLAYAQTCAESVLAVAAVITLIRLFRRFEKERASRLESI